MPQQSVTTQQRNLAHIAQAARILLDHLDTDQVLEVLNDDENEALYKASQVMTRLMALWGP